MNPVLPRDLVKRLAALWVEKKGYIPPHISQMLEKTKAKLEKKAA